MLLASTAVALSMLVSQADSRVDLRFDASQADATLALAFKARAGEPITQQDWDRIFATEPYQRLKQREAALGTSFSDEAFQRFARSDALAQRAPSLRQTLSEWASRDLPAFARRVLAYLPEEARISATVYPVIKPASNSFVYDLQRDAAIFLALNPEQSSAQFENTVAHELHHIGLASVPIANADEMGISQDARVAVGWMRAFGEGVAMLAAAGSVNVHPHAVSAPDVRARWDRDIARVDRDFPQLDAFLLAVAKGDIADEDEIRRRALAFFGEQGPWYTVGYTMAATIEREASRDALIACMLDPRQLLARYNSAAARRNAHDNASFPLWSSELLQLIGVE